MQDRRITEEIEYIWIHKINMTGVFDDETQNVVRAFNMHFHTDTTNDYECWDDISEARLNDLLTQISV